MRYTIKDTEGRTIARFVYLTDATTAAEALVTSCRCDLEVCDKFGVVTYVKFDRAGAVAFRGR